MVEASIGDLGTENRERCCKGESLNTSWHKWNLSWSEHPRNRENNTEALPRLSWAWWARDKEGTAGCRWKWYARVTHRNKLVPGLGGKGFGFHHKGKRCNSFGSFLIGQCHDSNSFLSCYLLIPRLPPEVPSAILFLIWERFLALLGPAFYFLLFYS